MRPQNVVVTMMLTMALHAGPFGFHLARATESERPSSHGTRPPRLKPVRLEPHQPKVDGGESLLSETTGRERRGGRPAGHVARGSKPSGAGAAGSSAGSGAEAK